jgi:SNF2 family DNA or RNA helicase
METNLDVDVDENVPMEETIVENPKVEEALKISEAVIKSRNNDYSGDYQRVGVKWMLSREFPMDGSAKGGIQADDMGAGKTFQMIATCLGNPMPTLIVTLVSTISQWRNAVYDFGGIRVYSVSASTRSLHLPSDAQIVVTTYSCFQQPKGPPACLLNREWGRIVLDEGHVMRNPKTKLYFWINKIRASIKWVLTGTPIQNREDDIRTLFKWMGVNDEPQDACKKYLIRRTQEEIGIDDETLRLPELKRIEMALDFENEEERKLNDLLEEHYEKLVINSSNKTMTALEGILRCRQLCVHPLIYIESIDRKKMKSKRDNDEDDDSSWIKRSICDNKVKIDNLPEPIAEILKNSGEIKSTKMTALCNDIFLHRKTEKSLIFCQWKFEIRLIEDMLNSMGMPTVSYHGEMSHDAKEVAINNFVHSKLPAMIMQIQCGATGLNLQAASRVYITSPNWNPTIELQAICRAHRKLQEKPVTFIRMYMKNTVEERCLQIQLQKLETIKNILNDGSFSSRLMGSMQLNPEDIKYVFGAKKRRELEAKRALEEAEDYDITTSVVKKMRKISIRNKKEKLPLPQSQPEPPSSPPLPQQTRPIHATASVMSGCDSDDDDYWLKLAADAKARSGEM